MICKGINNRTIVITGIQAVQEFGPDGQGHDMLEVETTDPSAKRVKGKVEVRLFTFDEITRLVEARDAALEAVGQELESDEEPQALDVG